MRIAQNLAIAWIITSGPGWPWNMVAGYWLLILRTIRGLMATEHRIVDTRLLRQLRIAAVAVLVLTAFGIFVLALSVPSSSWG
jgi:hypothetical protein